MSRPVEKDQDAPTQCSCVVAAKCKQESRMGDEWKCMCLGPIEPCIACVTHGEAESAD